MPLLKHSPKDLNSIPQLFDRLLYRQRLQRGPSTLYKKLSREVAKRLNQRLAYLRSDFPTTLLLGVEGDKLLDYLKNHKKTTLCIQAILADTQQSQAYPTIICDDEALPLAPGSVDLVIHFLGLHAANDVPGILTQSLALLKQEGLFLAAFIGNNSFSELRTVWATVELEQYGGLSQRLSPWIRTRDAGALLQRAGFGLPVADCDKLTVTYPDLKTLLLDLKEAQATSFLKNRKAPPLTRGLLEKAELLYRDLFPGESNQGIQISLDIVYMSGWRPSAHHQVALKPGTAMNQLADFL